MRLMAVVSPFTTSYLLDRGTSHDQPPTMSTPRTKHSPPKLPCVVGEATMNDPMIHRCCLSFYWPIITGRALRATTALRAEPDQKPRSALLHHVLGRGHLVFMSATTTSRTE